MDIPRKGALRNRRIRRAAYALLAAGAAILVTAGLSRLKPALPAVERGSVLLDTVKRGPLLRQVRGSGSLVPERIRWVTAGTAGRVERVLAQAGEKLDPDFVLVELSNQDLELQAMEAQKELTAAEADLLNLRGTLENQLLTQDSVIISVRNDLQDARRRLSANERLGEADAISELELTQSRDKVEELVSRLSIEEKRRGALVKASEAQLDGKEAQVERLRSLSAFRSRQLESLRVRAATEGVLKELPLEAGQWVEAGMVLAKVVDPRRLKAALKIAETQAKDLEIGQPASIDTRNGEIPGRVSRIDPAAQEGTVTVDVALEGELPRGARPDLSVVGTIEIERLEDVLYVGRPAFGQERSRVGLFKLLEDGSSAVCVPVLLGRGSVRTIEIVDGLELGDRVIVSDTSSLDAKRIRLR